MSPVLLLLSVGSVSSTGTRGARPFLPSPGSHLQGKGTGNSRTRVEVPWPPLHKYTSFHFFGIVETGYISSSKSGAYFSLHWQADLEVGIGDVTRGLSLVCTCPLATPVLCTPYHAQENIAAPFHGLSLPLKCYLPAWFHILSHLRAMI